MTLLRRVAAPVRLAALRARTASGATALGAVGIAAAAAMLVAVLGASLVARERSLSRSLAEVPVAQRAVRAAWFGVPGPGGPAWRALDGEARRALRPLEAGRRPTALVLYRQSTVAGRFVGIAGVEDAGRWVRLRSGRLPRSCRPSRCEVLLLGGEGALPDAPGLRLVVVGRATAASDALFGGSVAPDENATRELSPIVRQARAYHQPPPPPFVLAEGVAGLVAAPPLARLFRSYAWVLPLRAGTVRAWDVDGFAGAVDGARAALAASSGGFEVTAPIEEVRAAERSGRVSAQRLLVVGGEAAGLLLAFAALAAAGSRVDLARWRDRLAWAGAAGWQVELLGIAGAAATAVSGVLVGWVVGTAAAGLLARREHVPAADVVARSALSAGGLAAAALTAAAATTVIAFAQRPRTSETRGIRPLDVAAAGAAAALVVGLLRGEADAGRVATGSTGTFLLLLPGLVAFAAGTLAARVVPPALGGLARRVPPRWVSLRLALLALGRRSGYAGVAAGFLVVSLGLSLFAAAYRSTLLQGQREQAAFAVPVDLRVREDLSRLVAPTEAAPLTRFEALGADLRVEPVVRVTASVPGSGGLTVLGIDPDALPRLDGWRSDFAERPPAELARVIADDARVAGPRLPADARELRVSARGRAVTLAAVALRPDGRSVVLDLGRIDGGLLAPVPPQARGATLVRLVVRPATRVLERGADSGRALEGSFRLDGASVDGRPLDLRGWVGEGGLEPASRAGGVLVRYALTDRETAVLRPPQAVDATPPPALASPSAAAHASSDGTLTLRIAGRDLRVHVVATAERVPGIRGEHVVVARAALAAAAAAAAPGAAPVSEVWIDAPSPARAREVAQRLRLPPFDDLAVDSRARLADRLATDPLAEVTLATLVAAAFVALALAVAGLVLLVLSDARDERQELLDLEAQGAEPSQLRTQLRLRAGLLAAAGIALGAAAGVALAALVVGLVSVTANAGTPEPPLRLALDPVLLAAGAAVLAVVVAAAVAAASARAVGDPR
ncbi:MAG TPA: FtsX-like permease family protein [Gaiellaceae bacterium]|nr:FtsX-like permease family protein [Gaiellaceae bacterium]